MTTCYILKHRAKYLTHIIEVDTLRVAPLECVGSSNAVVALVKLRNQRIDLVIHINELMPILSEFPRRNIFYIKKEEV